MAFRDNYTNFKFNDISSETMKVWVTNNKDLQFQLTPSFTDTFVAPVAAKTRYHTATTFTSSDIQVKCIAIGVSIHDWRAIQNWLAPDKKGKLQLDFNDNTYYDVKIKQQIKGNSFVDGHVNPIEGDIYNIEFTVDFTTIGDWAALGPQVVVPINEKFQDWEAVEMLTPACSAYPALGFKTVKLTYKYNQILDSSNDWEDPEWWRLGLDPDHVNFAMWDDALNASGSYGAAGASTVARLLLQGVAGMNIATLSSSINNKYFMPMVYNKTASLNTATPVYSGITPSNTRNRVYLTQPTVLLNKTIKLDTAYYAAIKATDSEFFKRNSYFLFDSMLEWEAGFDGNEVDFTKLRSNYLAQIHEATLLNLGNVDKMVIENHPDEQDYGLAPISVIGDEGITFYGTPVLFGASNTTAYAACPFYYDADDNTYAVMNAGSYEAYPDLYVNLGRTTETTITKNGDLLYNYKMAIKNASLLFSGKTGFATFNNMMAEAATLASGSGNTKVVNSSINNGLLEIAPGRPELMKIRIFGFTESMFTRQEGDELVKDPIGVCHIFFQPVGEFKYARNEQFAALLFKDTAREQRYNTNFYPVVQRSYLDSTTYGSRVRDYTFSVNAFVHKARIATERDMWVLTIPKNEITSAFKTAEVDETGHLTTPEYMYLSLCDYTELSITSDTSAASYLMMQTRDAF
jgi:hypothetical protein